MDVILILRRGLIGQTVKTPSGFIGVVTGINHLGLARVAANGEWRDVPQNELQASKQTTVIKKGVAG